MAEKLVAYPGITAMAAYDILFALNDNQKAASLLTTMAVDHGTESVTNYLWTVNRLREKDQAPKDELATFRQFCAQAGFDFFEVCVADVAETIVSDAISSAVKLHVDRIS